MGSVCIGRFIFGLLHVFSRDFHLLLGLFYQEIKFTVGDAIDISCSCCIWFGYFFGLGVQQIAAGLEHLFDIDSGVQTQVILIAE
jgi:choline-glycine betaine transporter